MGKETISQTDPLRKRFVEKVEAFSDKYPDEADVLKGELFVYTSSVIGPGETVWDIIKSQIDYRVKRHKEAGDQISVEEFVDLLFEPNATGEIDAGIVMGRLQVWIG